MTVPLTKKQEELWCYIRSCERSPSFVEMRDALGYTSKSSIHRLIEALEERGYVRRIPNRARAIVVTEPAIAQPLSPEVRYIRLCGRIS